MKYKITGREKIGANKWNVTYETWNGCRCSAKEHYKIIESERMPTTKDLM